MASMFVFMNGGSTSCGVNGVIITGDLDRRSSRAPDYEAEARALTALAEAMSKNPGTVLQRLVEMTMELTRSDSAGISLLESGGEHGPFRWVATAGAWALYRDGTMPREESPCGEVIARVAVLLVKEPERAFPALLQAEPAIGEGLLAPFNIDGAPAGTLWSIMHGSEGRFDSEDARLLTSLARFASAANQAVLALEAARVDGRDSEVRYRALFETIGQGYSECELIRDEDGRAIDFRALDINPAFENLIGLSVAETRGRTARELVPSLEDWWIETYDEVVRSGERRIVEREIPQFGKWFRVDAYPTSGDRFITLFDDVTDRKLAEIALRDSELRFRALAMIGLSSVYYMSSDWRTMHYLDGAAFLSDTNDATVDWVDTYLPPDERPRVRKAISRAIATKGAFELEHRVLRADGTVGWTFSRAIPLLDDVGEISQWFGAATDITARVKADQSFTRLFRASPAPFLVLKPDAPHFTIAEVNDAYLSATMRTRDEVVGRGIFEAYPSNPFDQNIESVSALRTSLEKVLASRQSDMLPGLQYDVARPNGSFEARWWSPINSAVLDDDGEVEALIHNANDVTKERQAELRVQQLVALAEISNEFFGTCDMEFMPTYGNPAAMRMVGLVDLEQVKRTSLREFFFPEDRAFMGNEFFPRVLREGRGKIETRFRHFVTGEPVWVIYELVVLKDDIGRAIGFGTVTHDITERKRAGDKLRQTEERQAFLLKLSDALRLLSDAAEIMATTTRLLGTHMGADRVMYTQVNGGPGAETGTIHGQYVRPSSEGTRAAVPFPKHFAFSEFGEHIMAARYRGETLVVANIDAHLGFADTDRTAWAIANVRAAVVAGFVKNGRLMAEFSVHFTAPHNWSNAEVSLVEEVAERSWAAVQRAHAEIRLHDSEARFRQFSSAATNIFWIRNAVTMRMEFASAAFDTIYGIAGPDRGGDGRLRNWARLIVPEDRKRVFANFQRVRAGERVEQEFRIRPMPQGKVRWIRDVEFPLTDEQGRVQAVAGVGQDITAQKRAEEALREREERLGLIVENARDYAIFTIDPGGMITDWREGAEAVFGWSRAEAIGMDARKLFTPEDRKTGELEKQMKGAFDKGRSPDLRWHVHKDRSRVFIEGALTRLGGGIASGYLKIGQDVTKRHLAGAALSASEGRLQTLMQGIPQLVWRTCDKGLWTWASPQWLDFTGQIEDKSLGWGWLDVIHLDDHEKTKLSWAGAYTSGLLDIEYRVRRAADGAWIWHHTRSMPVRNEQGRIVEWLGTSTDVQLLKEFQERQGVLVAELQHRTRNLIAIVRSTSDKTARASADLTDFRARFRDRLDALARVQGLLSGLNDFDRVTFDDLIKAEMIAMDCDPGKVTLQGPSGVRLRSSTVQVLAMTLHELATNAVKYGALGQADAHLAVTWRWETSGDGCEPWLHIEWRETGVMMTPVGTAPRGTGQGRELIERALPYQLSAKTSYQLGRDGVYCTISLPVSATVASEETHD